MRQTTQTSSRFWGFTLVEMLVVVVIISLIATIATGVYTNATRRARIAAAQDLIRQLEIAITRYEVDLGVFPPSGSGDDVSPPSATLRLNGTGYLYLALVHSMSANALAPASPLWQGPYISLQEKQLAPDSIANVSVIPRYNILDPWGNPMFYVENQDYTTQSADFWGGTSVFQTTRPTDFESNPNLPAPNPFFVQGETYYNPKTYQIVSFGPDGVTPGLRTDLSLGRQMNYSGTGVDDVTNFGF